MTHATPIESGQLTIDAVLVGGPSDLDASRRIIHGVNVGEVKIKVLHRGGYEHFVRDAIQHPADASPSDSGATVAATYHWSARTEVAE
jgi:Family of unknown function (DUF5988)